MEADRTIRRGGRVRLIAAVSKTVGVRNVRGFESHPLRHHKPKGSEMLVHGKGSAVLAAFRLERRMIVMAWTTGS
ncbi:hypothetical protein LFE_0526 [Leptospirillum ferrooxidans C2-3]|uniref:Uncharacterized protein n=1 Tax=Leptospirillum ferrooxidans (strain C2-3) TaxID=1162668 RepID=I0ILU4_LEPFC|nr:hypothetical protein LFE_0526 [Leptospirillum ferrooxidans C2-3]